jgi:hypothetical protein
MQVKISYTSELNEVPKEVSSILLQVSREIRRSEEDLERSISSLEENRLDEAKVHMNLFKTKLQKMFSRLTDCQIVLDGYENAINQKQQQSESPFKNQENSVEE